MPDHPTITLIERPRESAVPYAYVKPPPGAAEPQAAGFGPAPEWASPRWDTEAEEEATRAARRKAEARRFPKDRLTRRPREPDYQTQPPPTATAIKIGDRVQWTSGGVDQFRAPLEVVWLSEDGLYARVEGDSLTGIKVTELTRWDDPAPSSEPRGDSEADAVQRLRQACWTNGYRPVAVYSPGTQIRGEPIEGAGKRPVSNDWIGLARRDPPDAVTRQPSPLALNTGILTGEVSAPDIDVLIPEVADQIVGLIERTLGPTPLHRIGRAPKILFCYRAAAPFAKLSTARFRMPDGTEAKFEILGDGQQFVAFGTHPKTMRPFEWPNASPLDVPLADLPTITVLEAGELIGLAEEVLRAAGGVIIKKEGTKPARADGQPERGNGQTPGEHDQPGASTFFRAVNTAALANIPAWVTALHPGFEDRGNSGWRLTSKDLDRNLQEDISVHPRGIWDFGTEESLTAIDLVIRLGGATDAVAAALWLCDRLDIKPKSLGWHGPTGGQQRQYGNGQDRDEQQQRQEPRSPTICPRIWQGQRVPDQGFVIDEWLPGERVTGFYGGSGHGKTNTAHQLQTAMALNKLWLGLETNWAASLGVYCEDDEKELHRRQHFINEHYQCAMADLGHMHLKPRLGMDNWLIAFDRDGKPDTRPFYQLLLEEALDLKVKLIVIDTIADVFGGDENNRAQVRRFGQGLMGGLARATGAAVLLLGRPSLSGQSEGRSGTTEWGGVFRAGWFLNKPSEDDPDGRELIRNRATYASHGKHTAIPLRWHNGLFIPDTDEAVRRRSCLDTFLLLLDTFWRQDRALSASNRAGADLYAPKVFAGLPRGERGGYSQKEFEAAMELLRFKEYIRAAKQDPDTGETWRSPRLVRLKQGWYKE